jgi:DNA-binding Lrp family transcriptional regulator
VSLLVLHQIDELDEQIISLLEADGRRSAAEIALELGTTRGKIHRRIERLIDEELITIRAFAISRNIGLPVHLFFTFRVAFEQLAKVAQAATTFKELRWVAVTSGRSNILAEGYFSSNQHLHAFVTRRLAPLPGILEVETLNVLSLEKFAFDWTAIRHASEDYEAQPSPGSDGARNGVTESTPTASRLRQAHVAMAMVQEPA